MRITVLSFILGLMLALLPFFFGVTCKANIVHCAAYQISYKPASLFILALVLLLISLFRLLKLNKMEKPESLSIHNFAENNYEGVYINFAENKNDLPIFIEYSHEDI